MLSSAVERRRGRKNTPTESLMQSTFGGKLKFFHVIPGSRFFSYFIHWYRPQKETKEGNVSVKGDIGSMPILQD